MVVTILIGNVEVTVAGAFLGGMVTEGLNVINNADSTVADYLSLWVIFQGEWRKKYSIYSLY